MMNKVQKRALPESSDVPEILAVLEAVCLAALAEISRQRAGGNEKDPSPQRRPRPVAPRVVPTSEVCSKAALNALIDLGRAGLVRRGHA